MKKTTLAAFFYTVLFLISSPARSQTDVLTQHNDVNRTGWNPTELILNQSNVTPSNFGLLYRKSVDDQIYAQPLVVSGVTVTDPNTHASVVRNVVYVATVNNTLYAFDADDGTLAPYWSLNFTPSGKMVPNSGDIHASLCGYTYGDFQGYNGLHQNASFGIVGTPVIDKATNTIYLVSRYRELVVDNTIYNTDPAHSVDQGWSSAGFYQQVHALDLSTGADKFNSPVLIDPVTTFVNGTGPGHDASNQIHFDPRRQNQRPGLLLLNGIVYIGYSGHCDMDDYHGWILGYKANDLNQQLVRYLTAPNDERGGIWMSGAGLAADASGNIYFANGNVNNSSLANSQDNVGLSVVKVTPDLPNQTLHNVSWLKPSSYTTFNTSDLDFGTGVIPIPGTNMLVTAHKSGKLFVMKQLASPQGEFNELSPNFLQSVDLGAASGAGSHSSLTYFGGSPTPYLYQFSENTHALAYAVNTSTLKLITPAINNLTIPTNVTGGYSSVSSNGNTAGSGILWVTHRTNASTGVGSLYALMADNIAQELWNSDANPIDALGISAKMNTPTIANGKVYVPTFSDALAVYGLLANNNRCIVNVALNKTATGSSNTNTDPVNGIAAGAVDGTTSTRWSTNGGNPSYLYVDLGGRYDICKVNIIWHQGQGTFTDYAVNFTIDVSDDGISWTTVNTVTGNSFTQNVANNEFNEHVTTKFVRMFATQGGFSGTSIMEFQIYGTPANSCIAPAVANMTATSITQNSAVLNWKPVTGVTDYIVKYRGPTVSSFITRLVHDGSGSGNTLSLPISALTCGYSYEFDIQSDCGSGKTSARAQQLFTTSTCSAPCLNLTRFAHGDLGDILAPGTACYADPVFTLTGAGGGLGGTSDQFQFNYTGLNKDEEFIMRVASQDVSPSGNQAGIMMRDSLTDYSRFIFVGKTGDDHLMMIYRNTNGGSTSSPLLLTNPGNANFFRIVKAGTTYGAFYGNTVTGPWTQLGSSQNLGFGSQGIYIGMAVSSLNGTSTSSASFDNLIENSTPLPIQLLNFSASNEHDEFVSLKWQTGMEENNDHFEIERSTNGTGFDKIVSVKAVGNSSTLQSYSAVDNKPENGLNFYRLKQVDLDRRFTYSTVKSIRFGAGASPVVYPNPVSTVLTAVPGIEPIREIVIYNVLGKAVQFEMGHNTDAEMKVNVAGLSAGVYFVKVKTESKIFQFKIVKE
jgi:hypothetical protein